MPLIKGAKVALFLSL